LADKKIKLISIVIAALCFSSCRKEATKSSFETKILGNWRVVDATNEPSDVEWGLFYVLSTKLYGDRSFKINLGDGIDDNVSKTGTWTLNENINSIIFYTVVTESGTIYRDTTEFSISIDSQQRLILKNDKISIAHVKLSN
jgi:hypothetical protein